MVGSGVGLVFSLIYDEDDEDDEEDDDGDASSKFTNVIDFLVTSAIPPLY